MSNEGVTLISRVVLVAVLIIATAVARALVGPSKRRGFYMQIGTLGGMSGGVAVALLMSRWLATDVSVISACLARCRAVVRLSACGPKRNLVETQASFADEC